MTHSGSAPPSPSRDTSASQNMPDADAQRGLFDHVTTSIQARPPEGNITAAPARADAQGQNGRAPRPIGDKAGHRTRLLERFRDGGAEAMPDYELLEMILFRVFPRGDTKPVAKALMAKFKNFSEVINAPDERLMEVAGVGQRAVDEIKLVRAAALRMLQKQMLKREMLSTWSAVLDYCKAAQGHDEIERFRILFLDKRNQLIADEVQQSGTVDHTPVYVREIIKRALQLGATALVLVHNHPSGDPSPSRADIDMTKQIVSAALPLGVTVHDHVIVGRNGHFSFRSAKLM